MGSGRTLATGLNVPALVVLAFKPETDPVTILSQDMEEILVLAIRRAHNFVKFHLVQVQHC